MKSGDPSSYMMWRIRVRQAREVLIEGGNLKDVAARWGTSLAYVSKKLKEKSPSTHEAIISGYRRKDQLSIPDTVHRLQTIKRTRTHQEAAAELGISRAAVTQFIKRFAPDGIDDALELYGIEEAA